MKVERVKEVWNALNVNPTSNSLLSQQPSAQKSVEIRGLTPTHVTTTKVFPSMAVMTIAK